MALFILFAIRFAIACVIITVVGTFVYGGTLLLMEILEERAQAKEREKK